MSSGEDELAQYRQRLLAQQPEDAPTLRALLDAPRRAVPSITVIVQYDSAAALCLQLHALLRQTARPEQVLVSALNDPDGDGGAIAQRVIDTLPRSLPTALVVTHVPATPGAVRSGVFSDRSGAHAFGRLSRFALGLQVTSRHTLVLDWWVLPPPTALASLGHVSELPEGFGVLGFFGWRMLASPSGSDRSGGGVGGGAGVGGSGTPLGERLASIAMPCREFGIGVERLSAVDALRGAWFVRTSWLPLLLHEELPRAASHRAADAFPGGIGSGGAAERSLASVSVGGKPAQEVEMLGNEAWLSLMWRRHGDLPSLVLPSLGIPDGGEGAYALSDSTRDSWPTTPLPPVPTAAQETAWREQLWAGIRRGDVIPPWRSTPLVPHVDLPHSQPEAGGSPGRDVSGVGGSVGGSVGGVGGGVGGGSGGPGRRPVALLIVSDLHMARQLGQLYSALSSDGSAFEPRLVLSPELTGGCQAVAKAMLDSSMASPFPSFVSSSSSPPFPKALPDCHDPSSVHILIGNAAEQQPGRSVAAAAVSAEGGWAALALSAERAAAAAALQVELDTMLEATQPAFVLFPIAHPAPGAAGRAAADRCSPLWPGSGDAGGAAGQNALADALRAALAPRSASVPLLEPPARELHLLEWLAIVPPSAMRRWHEPRIEVAVVTHRRPASLRRLLRSLRCAHYFGDTVDLAFSLEAGADNETISLAAGWEWPHGQRRASRRAVKGGLIAAVVESWYPSGDHSYGLLLEDDIEVSPLFYLYMKLTLLRYVYAAEADGGGGGVPPPSLLGISLYTPRLVELTMPRHKIDLYQMLGPGGPSGGLLHRWHASYGGLGHLFLQQLPCSWGQLFFPTPWLAFRQYMRARLHEGAPAVNIKDSACCQGTRWGNGGWGTSWKKFLIELSFLKGYVVLYPNFRNQSSLSTNHLEQGEHIAGKVNALKHNPLDFTVPLIHDLDGVRALWTTTTHGAPPVRRRLAPLAPLHSLSVLDLFSIRSSQEALAAKGEATTPRGLSI